MIRACMDREVERPWGLGGAEGRVERYWSLGIITRDLSKSPINLTKASNRRVNFQQVFVHLWSLDGW